MSVAHRRNLKLSPRFYGPFPIIQKVGSVAYKLQLPPTSTIHSVFHVSQLKKTLGQRHVYLPTLPPMGTDGNLKPEPEKILHRRVWKHHNQPLTECLVQWKGQNEEDASWEPYEELKASYPHLAGKVL
ncbi:hypothetical protein F2P56_008836 [Juglans regia]|uniref:Chromo domain-containing protein n=1 Tax=Juglans regia TaxID=51240 RepID=A0A833XVD7_JUGRE|nr:hypothetical protein F2P56_008836 [Juglans regia]